MWNALQIELLKWRRTALVWVTVAAGLATPLLTGLMFASWDSTPTWHDVMKQTLAMYAVMTGPLIATLIGAQSIASEYQYDTWKLSFTAPIGRGQVYLAKVLLGLVWLLSLSALIFGANWLAGLALPIEGGLPEPLKATGQFLMIGLGLSVMLPFHHLITLFFRSFFVTSGVGIVATFTGLIVLNSKYAGLYPLSGTFMLIFRWFGMPEDTSMLVGSEPLWLAVLAATFLVPMLASLFLIKRADLAWPS